MPLAPSISKIANSTGGWWVEGAGKLAGVCDSIYTYLMADIA
jgi:hypothetical protein